MAGGRNNRFTIYDALEKSGYFDNNAANSFARNPIDGSQLYKGPVEYPRMFYHPQGEEKITVPAEVVSTPMGAKEVGEQRELLWQIAQTPAEGEALRADGWHDHPAKAVRARVLAHVAALRAIDKIDEKTERALLASIPQMSSDQRIKDLEAELARITEDKTQEQAARMADLAEAGPGPVRSGADALAARG